MDIIEYEDDFQDQDHFNPFGRAAWAYMEKQFRECPECNAKIGTLCPDCMIELNRRIEQSNGYIWSERLQKDNPSMNDPGYGPWLARQLESELSVCGQEALYRGIPIEIALKQSIKIQWIQTELSRIGYKQDSPASRLDRLEWNCSTAVYVHIVKELLTKGYLILPGMNAKEGDGNITELFRRLSQSITVSGRGGELSPDELQRRFNGRALAQSKAERLTLPEAKDMK